VLGLQVSPGSLVFYVITGTTLLSALVLPVIGAVADRSASQRRLMARLAWTGAGAATAMGLVAGTNWPLGVLLLFVANLSLGGSLVVYDAILCRIATPDERDAVSSRGWALGYLGGGLLLAANLALVTLAESLDVSTATAVRISLVSAGLWWAAFTLIPYRGLRDRPPAAPPGDSTAGARLMQRSFGQLWVTLRSTRHYPQTLLFLVAYLFYNDGIQTVIASASVYGEKELGLETSFLILAILVVQFVAFGGALLFGRIAAAWGSKQTILTGLLVWCLVVSAGYFLPAEAPAAFLGLAVGIGLVLGGTQALSRSFYSQLVPLGREAEYFSLYQACERGTSWLGTLLFGVIYQLTGSYRPAILALVAFFVIGASLLVPLDARRAIREAGNEAPARV
jgi:UMF1 family MFS transporter